MAKQYTITASVNGGAATQHAVAVKDTEGLFDAGFLYRVWKSYGMSQGDDFTISSISGPVNINDPMTWDAVPPLLVIAVSSGNITLAFIE